jgi:hypothetical protein
LDAQANHHIVVPGRSRLSPAQVNAIIAELNRKIDAQKTKGRTVNTSTWMTPGKYWQGTPFECIYDRATNYSDTQAALCFGLFVQEVFMNRPETWTSEHFEKDGEPIKGRTLSLSET